MIKVGLFIVLLATAAAVVGPSLTPYDPAAQTLAERLEPPSRTHPFGLDELGRDILSRLVSGARISLLVGLAVVTVSSLIGMALGSAAGYFGGLVDDVISRAIDILMAFPGILLAIALVAVLGPSLTNVVLALCVIGWVGYARLVRGQALRARELEYVQAARALGMPHGEIILIQILPNALPPVIVVSTLTVATAILTESGLSFLGLGDPNLVSWGYMIGVARTALRVAWWMTAIPGLMIVITVIAINLAGEGLNDALNPKLRAR